MKTTIAVAVIVVLAALALGGYWWVYRPAAPAAPGGTPSGPVVSGDTLTLGLGQSGTVNGVMLTPREVVEDSRCPSDVQCIQAGRVRVRATLSAGMGAADQVFLVGQPITTEAEAVTLIKVEPETKLSTKPIALSEYRFTFKVVKQALTYTNATADLITIDTPYPGSVVGKTFTIRGKARGYWYFEASFPVIVLDKDGNRLFGNAAQAQGEWMTTDFVPFSIVVTVPSAYIGPATIVLEKDNPSGLPQNNASVSFPVTIEY